MKVASIQLSSNEGETKQERITKADRLLATLWESGQRPVQIIFPEIWATGFFSFDRYIADAEQEQGDIYEMMASWAKRFGCYLHTGSFVERDGESFYNTSLMINPNGRVIGKYRKIHLFSFGSREMEILSPGSILSTVTTEYGKVGMSTCYDLRFPELFRGMINLGAEYFLIASAWPLARLEHWKLFNKVRAVENQSYLISCNGTGTINGSQLGGHSMIVDPWGEVLATGDTGETTLVCEVDPAQVEENRKKFPALRDKRLV